MKYTDNRRTVSDLSLIHIYIDSDEDEEEDEDEDIDSGDFTDEEE